MVASRKAQVVVDERFTLVRHRAKGEPMLDAERYLMTYWLPTFGPTATAVYRTLVEHVDPMGAVTIDRAGLMARCGITQPVRLFGALYRLTMFFPHPGFEVATNVFGIDPVVREISANRVLKLATMPEVAA